MTSTHVFDRRIGLAAAIGCAAGVVLLGRVALAAGVNDTLFLNHFDQPLGLGAGPADYANGDPNQTVGSPFGPGGLIVASPAKFGPGSLYRYDGSSVGGRVQYNIAGNFDYTRGTVECWINSATLTTAGGFQSFFGTVVPSSAAQGDMRFYIYDTGAGRTLGAYMASQSGGFWECEQPVPTGVLTNNQWHHVAWCWDLASQSTAIFWDGQMLRNTPDAGTVGFNGTFSRTEFHIGESQFGSADFPGYMDEFRISDVMRYTGNFTPPTDPFSVTTGSQWNIDASGSWSASGNWSGGAPNAVGSSAVFGSVITAPRTVTVDAAVTVGSITFDNPNAYTIAGISTLTLDGSTSTAITVANGSHTVSAPMLVQKDLMVTVTNASDKLALSNDVAASSAIITKAGAGSLVAMNVRALALSVTAGTVQVAAKGTPNSSTGTSKVFGLAIASGAKLDLTNNSLIIGYSGSVGTLVSDVREHLQAGRMLSSSGTGSTRLGYGDNAILGKTSFGGMSVDASNVLIKYTYGGDTNLDGQVDITDLGNLATHWQTAGVWIDGDSNYDGFIDITDLGILATHWQAGVGSPLGPDSLDAALASVGLGVTSIPEPASLALIGFWLAAAPTRRFRPRLGSRRA